MFRYDDFNVQNVQTPPGTVSPSSRGVVWMLAAFLLRFAFHWIGAMMNLFALMHGRENLC